MFRAWLLLSIGSALAFATFREAPGDAQQVDASSGSAAMIIAKLKPGQFLWAPQLAPEGPMILIINLKTQRALLYRNGVPVGATTISTGRPGHDTPTGIFTILEKQVVHHSSKYDNAPMPYMERLTWSGVALHAGKLPGYRASHGCIRMPPSFAKLLYGLTSIGMTVVIADAAAVPRVAPTPSLVSRGDPGATGGTISWSPQSSPTGPVAVIVSVADHRALVLRNGTVIGSAPVKVEGPVTGTFAYALKSVNADGQHWVRLQLSPGGHGENAPVPKDEWQRYTVPDAFRKAVASIVEPGMTIVVTPDSLRTAASPVTVLESGN